MDLQTDMSAEIGELAAALAAAQGEITGALKDSKNPFFKSSYADLASCWEACRGPLSKNGLAVIQTPLESDNGVKLKTMLAHKSGQWIRGTLCMTPTKSDPQGIGSCLTYARRYALAAIVGLSQIDDDANQASGKSNYLDPRGDEYKKVDPKVRDGYVKRLTDAMNADKEDLDIADDIYEIHSELIKDNDMYIAVGEKLSKKDQKAVREYIQIYKTRNNAA